MLLIRCNFCNIFTLLGWVLLTLSQLSPTLLIDFTLITVVYPEKPNVTLPLQSFIFLLVGIGLLVLTGFGFMTRTGYLISLQRISEGYSEEDILTAYGFHTYCWIVGYKMAKNDLKSGRVT